MKWWYYPLFAWWNLLRNIRLRLRDGMGCPNCGHPWKAEWTGHFHDDQHFCYACKYSWIMQRQL